MSRILPYSLALISLMSASTAFAHEGDHSAFALSTIIHWLSSPTHSLFAVMAGAVFILAAIKLARKNRA